MRKTGSIINHYFIFILP